jgi:hypothetical protein
MKTGFTFNLRYKLAVLLLLGFAGGVALLGADQPDQTTVEGLVRDISCPIQNKQATATTFNMKCALECARQGSPLIILTKDGSIYVPISDSMPDSDQRPRLMPFVGKYVKATGKVYERNGTRAIAISQITEMKDVHLITNAE